jgi:protein involved in polysaccharide export with SLBB domain
MKNGKSLPVRAALFGATASFVFGLSVAPAQSVSARAGAEIPDELLPSDTRAMSGVFPPQAPALESVVSADVYFVGPSDVLGINVWVTPPLIHTLPVTPEGTIILPTVGEIRVADRSLAEVKRSIAEEVRRRYRKGEITVTLLRPRSVVVMVTGHVATPGLYTMTSVDRVNKAIEQANKPTRAMELAGETFPTEESSTRNIALLRRDGSSVRVDVDRFFATRDDRWNPFLREGDVITVPRRSTTRNVIGVYGEVNAPGRYEFVEGDSLQTIVDIAQGLTRLARPDSVMLSRLDPGGSSMRDMHVVVRGSAGGEPSFIRLEPGDRVVVPAREDLREDYRATVIGEVVRPGTYPITRGTTRLTDLIGRAGGFTGAASLSAASVVRAKRPFLRGTPDSLLSFRGRSAADDMAYYENEAKIQWGQDFVQVDFVGLFQRGDSTNNIILHSEDTVRVPLRLGTVYVFGQVRKPGHVPFVQGRDLWYYVDQAGGLTDLAREGDIRLIKAASRQWLSVGEAPLEDGDQIWIPKDVERSFSYYLGLVGQTASILSVALSIVILSIQLGK